MKKVNFIGAYDKTNCMMYVAKILTTLGKKILIIDSTINQKARYVVPAVGPTVSYVTEFEEMDIAVGFNSLAKIKEYLGIPLDAELNYDYIFCDIDSRQSIDNFEVKSEEDNYFVTGFDIYSLKRGLEALYNLRAPLTLTKVLYSKEMSKEEDDYLNYLSQNMQVIWKEDRIYFPIENGDNVAFAENERLSRIKFKNISVQYKESLLFITEQLATEFNPTQLRKTMKTIEKGE